MVQRPRVCWPKQWGTDSPPLPSDYGEWSYVVNKTPKDEESIVMFSCLSSGLNIVLCVHHLVPERFLPSCCTIAHSLLVSFVSIQISYGISNTLIWKPCITIPYARLCCSHYFKVEIGYHYNAFHSECNAFAVIRNSYFCHIRHSFKLYLIRSSAFPHILCLLSDWILSDFVLYEIIFYCWKSFLNYYD